MTTFHTLASGSSGNAAVLHCGADAILIDAGISCRRISAALAALGLSPAALSAIAVTHTHSDHIAGLPVLLRQTACPVLASPRVCRELAYRIALPPERLLALEPCRPFALGAVTVIPVPLSHDAPGACGFRFDTPDGGVALLTDTGYVTEDAAAVLPGVELAVLEANHDPDTLRGGRYPYYLKNRILSRQGHLCNADAAAFAVTLAAAGAREIVLAHLSAENNTPQLALSAVEQALAAARLHPALSVAPRSQQSAPHRVEGSRLCRK